MPSRTQPNGGNDEEEMLAWPMRKKAKRRQKKASPELDDKGGSTTGRHDKIENASEMRKKKKGIGIRRRKMLEEDNLYNHQQDENVSNRIGSINIIGNIHCVKMKQTSIGFLAQEKICA